MKKTLIVSYTPRKGSNTRKLVDCFIAKSKGKTEIDFLDLAGHTPDVLVEENLQVMLKRNFMGEGLSEEEEAVLAKNDNMLKQVQNADFIVLAHPMYNFSVPAAVKAWIDAILQPRQTFALTEQGYQGLCMGKEAVVLMTTGNDFSLDLMKDWDFATGLTHTCFKIIGIPATHITAGGMNRYPAEQVESILAKAMREIDSLVENWYSEVVV